LRFSQQTSELSKQTEISFLLTLNKHKNPEAQRVSRSMPSSDAGPGRPIRVQVANAHSAYRRGPAISVASANEGAVSGAFSSLGLSGDIEGLLAKSGITAPFPIQSATIPDALAGRDVCGKARTGSGKTLAFGLPIVELTQRCEPRRPHSLVLAPTRELANQIATNLAPFARLRGLRVGAIYGGASMNRQAADLRSGIDILVATPGRLNDMLERRLLTVAGVGIVVVDEADQMADFGFLPQVERILDQIEGGHQTLLFSATLGGDVERLIRRYQHDPVYHEVAAEPETEEAMQHRFIAVSDAEKVPLAATIAAGPQRTLFFTRTQRGADRLARLLDREGIRAGVLHGSISQPKRERALRLFAQGEVPVLVATNIAARGIHVDGVDTVVHFDPPEDPATYLHRSGRTARAGATGVVVTLVQPLQVDDVNLLRRQAGVREAIVPMAPTDVRLHDLAAWTPPIDESRPVRNAPDVRPRGESRGGGQGRRGRQWGGNRGGQRRERGWSNGPMASAAR
jgi:superfamily II DNA/RNA helicase